MLKLFCHRGETYDWSHLKKLAKSKETPWYIIFYRNGKKIQIHKDELQTLQTFGEPVKRISQVQTTQYDIKELDSV